MSTLFVVARYVGLALAIISGLWSGSGIFFMSDLACIVVNQIIMWTKLLYIVVMDVIMILRVTVMFNPSKRPRQILFSVYSLVTINSIVFSIVWVGPDSGLVISAVTAPLLGGTICASQGGRSGFGPIYDGIPRGLFDILLIALAVYRFTVHSIEARRIMGRQKINTYMRLLLEHSVLYFFLNFAYEALAMGTLMPSPPTLYLFFVALYMGCVPFMIYPRLVLSMKGYRAASGGFHVGNDGSGYPRAHGHSKSLSVPVTDSTGEYELPEGTTSGTSQKV